MKKLFPILIGILLTVCTMQYVTIRKVKKTANRMENKIEILQNENRILKANKINCKDYYINYS
ncbi:hypothetical protein CLTEP_18740 [Clostridium tepidiprofundi DSM 19306]|uniref:Uncharacterized protein n=1 Tax=Clostridium tepidiprofundi DSM 19306 TaxID=1121338 RepID=A0A151B2T3_9CLOT|nr:hypothetical protein [Clostridium tepidiprofundi]KYH34221.1 hypothetical protein CLTEP_18740 [Clostridium tepidiprofundi DSM 19306]